MMRRTRLLKTSGLALATFALFAGLLLAWQPGDRAIGSIPIVLGLWCLIGLATKRRQHGRQTNDLLAPVRKLHARYRALLTENFEPQRIGSRSRVRIASSLSVALMVSNATLSPVALAQSEARSHDNVRQDRSGTARGSAVSSTAPSMPTPQAWPNRRVLASAESAQARTAGSGDITPTVEEVRAKLTRNPVRLLTTGKPLSDLQTSIEAVLGVRLILAPGAGSLPVNGEIAGDDGMGFLRELAARVRLEWAFSAEGLFVAPEGGSKATSFAAPSAEVASRAAAIANQEFDSLGSGIRVVSRKDEVIVTGIPAWVNQVASLRMPGSIEIAERTMPKDESLAVRAKPVVAPEPLSLMVFRLSNAFVDDKRLQVGNYAMIIPGVATLFRQFTGLGGGSSEAPALARSSSVARLPRVDPVTGSRSYRRDDAEIETERQPQERSERQTLERARGARPEEPVVIADSRMNTLIVRDRASMLEAYQSLVKVLDQTAEMVQLDAFIIDIKASRLDEFGIGLSWSGSGRVNASGVLPGGTIPAGANLILQGVRGAQLLAQIRALESQGDSEILTVPSVVTLNNLEATFSARESFFVKVAGNLDTSLNEVTAETLLKVTPLLTQQVSAGNGTNRRIRLLISVQDGSVDASTSAVVDNLPRTRVNQISTQALVRGGDTLVIGGQVVRKRIQNVAGLPLIRNIPILGALTGSRSDQTEQYVRIYVVRPRILGDGLAALDEPVAEERKDPLVNGVLGRVPAIIRGSGLSPLGLDADRPRSAGATTDPHFVVPMPRAETQSLAPAEKPAAAALAPAVPAPDSPRPVAPAMAQAPTAKAATPTTSIGPVAAAALPDVAPPTASPRLADATPSGAPTATTQEAGPPDKRSPAPGPDLNPVAAGKGTYFVQLGRFSQPERAKALVAKMDEIGVRVYADAMQGESGELTRLRAGPFTNRAAAERTRVRLEELGRSLSFKPGPVQLNDNRG